MSLIILNRIAVMFVYMAIGFILYKNRIVTDDGAREIGKLLIYVILPSAIVSSYNMEFTREKALGCCFRSLRRWRRLLCRFWFRG